ncbi:hypothetical protein SLEP1_g41344 [Rubroshorea leprosula]|uniref:Integrase catalytic domain-containing protein n=1 Tax=Rubroshorea leprosula TaxID=152421 RepID=A0AAV5L6N7_9ROSI|nr:hypothetical protein SLEP1_g41344 [Rubroshorea leprosula]
MGVDADPFPTMSVGVNAADLKSIARDRTQTYYRRRLTVDDLRWVIEETRAGRNQVRSGLYQRRQPRGQNSTQQKDNANQGTAISGNAEKPRMVKPPLRSPSKRWERVVHPKFPKGQNPRTLRRRLQRKRAAERHRQQITDSGDMADQAQPLPARRKSVWVRKEKGSTSDQNALEKEEPLRSPTSPLVLVVESNEETGLKAKFDMSDEVKISSNIIHFGEFSVNLSCLVITLPLVFQAREQSESVVCHQTDLNEEEEVIEIPAKEDSGMDSADKIIFEKPEERMARHIRPLYIHAHLDGMPINRVLVDNGAIVNVLPTCIMHKIGKSLGDLMETEVTISDSTSGVNRSREILPVELTVGNRTLMCAFFVVDTIATYNALLGRDWIHFSWCVPSTLHQKLIFWNGGRTKVVTADDKPFMASTNAVEARYYDEDIGTIRFFGMDRYGRPSGITACTRSAMDRQTDCERDRSEVVYEGEEEDLKDQITLEELDLALAKLDDLKAKSPRRMSPEVTLKVKEEIERLLKVGFIITSRYVEWLSNVVLVVKKNGKLRICVDFRNLNLATPKDEYPMPIVDLLVDGAARHRILSFMDGHSGYNQIFIAEEDISKTAFRCPGAIGTYEWVVMPFGLKNVGATYQRAMNAIFHDMIGRFMEIYIDDVVVKSNEDEEHLEHLKLAFERMRKHSLKMNPLKCAFGVSAGNFLGYLVHERGLEVDQNKANAVIEVQPPRSKKELQRFLGQVNFLRRFISNLAGKTRVFSPLLKLKSETDFKWERHHQTAFEEIKHYLSKPPVLMPPLRGKPLILYISAADESVGCLLAQENSKKQEQAVYYLSRSLSQTEVKYFSVEKLCLALFFAAIKLRHYLLYSEVYVISKTDVIKYMLSRPLLRGRIGKWVLALSEFNLKYMPQKAVKGQALADFLADHPCLEVEADEEKGIDLFSISLVPWKLIFDGSSIDSMSGAGIIIISPVGLKTQMSFQLDFNCTNNQAEYEALIIGLEVLVELKLLEEFDDVILRHVTRDLNTEANKMAQIASGLKIPEGVMSIIVVVEKRILPSIHTRGMVISACSLDVTQTDWRYPIMEYLKNPNFKASRRTKMQALNYVLLESVLYKKGHDELLLRCLGPDEYCQIMSDVHNGICGAHQAGIKMRWLIHRHGFFWPSILKDCISYAKGWAIDLIGKVYPPSTRGHSFIIVATDYFTKWVEAKPMKKVDQTDIIKFLKEEIIHRFGLPETVTSDQGTVFVGAQVEAFAKEMGFRLLTSTPHYAQANGQAEASNRIDFTKEFYQGNSILFNLWTCAVLPMELSARSLRIAIQHGLTSGEYNEAMILELEDLEGMRLMALDRLQTHKLKVARAYNKRVKSISLAVGDLVWKVILPPGKKDPRFGKWSPNWEGPFCIHEVLRGGAYWLESLNGELHPRKINGIYLKPYYPMIWEARGLDAIDST